MHNKSYFRIQTLKLQRKYQFQYHYYTHFVQFAATKITNKLVVKPFAQNAMKLGAYCVIIECKIRILKIISLVLLADSLITFVLFITLQGLAQMAMAKE